MRCTAVVYASSVTETICSTKTILGTLTVTAGMHVKPLTAIAHAKSNAHSLLVCRNSLCATPCALCVVRSQNTPLPRPVQCNARQPQKARAGIHAHPEIGAHKIAIGFQLVSCARTRRSCTNCQHSRRVSVCLCHRWRMNANQHPCLWVATGLRKQVRWNLLILAAFLLYGH